MTSWSLITVTYNSAEALTRHWDGDLPADVEWLVVDNASIDGSAEVAGSRGASVTTLDRNGGFSVANNVGLGAATGAYVAFVNPDVTVDFATLNRLAARIDECGGLVAPQLLNPDGSLQPNARGVPFLVDKLANRGVALPFSKLDDYVITGGPGAPTAEPIVWSIGAALAGRVETFRTLGGWDERFFIYYEDHEIGLRAWKKGIPVWIDRSIQWRHGWDRATTRASLPHWRHELASAWSFYRMYPGLLLPTTRMRRRYTALLGLPNALTGDD